MAGFTISVQTADLKKILADNRDRHAKDYQKAKVGWRKLVRKELQDKLDVLDNGGKFVARIENQKPESHMGDYDEAIEMVGHHSEPTITLDGPTYRQFVKDDWNWRAHWAAANTTYIENA